VKFPIIIAQIKDFAIRHDADDGKRCLVCGIVWWRDAIAVNTGQISLLIGRSRSSINASFQATGFSNGNMAACHTLSLLGIFPFLKHNSAQFRRWTIREYSNNLGGVRTDFSTPEKSISDPDHPSSFTNLGDSLFSLGEETDDIFEF
jgi:hypothetical protein